MKGFVAKLQNVKMWRYALFVVLIVLTTNGLCIYYTSQFNMPFVDFVLIMTNNMSILSFSFLYVMLLMGCDFLFEPSKNISVICSDIKKNSIKTMLFTFIYTLILIGVFIAISFVVFTIYSIANNSYSTVGVYTVSEFFISIIFITFRFTATFLIILLINVATHSYIGAIIAIVFNQFEYNFYNIFDMRPLLILPKYHTLVNYGGEFETVLRTDYFYSFIYWIVVFVLIYFLLTLVQKRKKGEINECSN